jgi:peptide/nickel transport system substrate-binding protein
MNRLFFAGLLAATSIVAPFGCAYAQAADREVKIVLPLKFDNIDACNTTSEQGAIVSQNVVESLTYLSVKDGSVTPRLATEWTQIEPTVWRLKIREGVKFHDGTDLDATAVSAAINRMFKPDLDCLNRFKLFSNITLKPSVVDAYTVDIKTDNEQVLMPTLLSFVAIDSPKTDTAKLSNAPVGTGPFTVAPRNPGDDAVLTAFDGYWGEKPDVEKATFTQRDESTLRAAMVKVGEADIAVGIASQDANDPALDLAFPNGETTRVRFTFKPPLDDIRVRRAFNLAVDREALRDGLFTPDFKIATQLFGPGINGYNPDIPAWKFDVAEAKKLIAEARADGVPVDTTIPLVGYFNFYPNGQEALEALIAMWADVGLNVKLEMIERAQWLKVVNKPFSDDRRAMLLQESHANTNGDAAFTMRFRYHTKGQQTEFSDPKLDQLIESAEKATGTERQKLFGEANSYAYSEIVPDVLMFQMASFIRVSERLDFKPDYVNKAQLELSRIHFKAD